MQRPAVDRDVHRDLEPPFAKSAVEVADENVGDDCHKNDEDFLFSIFYLTPPIVPGGTVGKQ